MNFFKNPFNFIKKANKTFNIYLANHKKLEAFLGSYGENRKKTEAFWNAFLDIYGENQEKTEAFIDYVQEDLKMAIETFNKNYNSCKEYFFNGNEDLFKHMDTDQFFQMCFFNNIKLLSYSPAENRIYLKTEDGLLLITNNRFYTIKEIFAKDGYSVPQLHLFKEFVVFDIGMNRGYAALKFANFDACKAVYGFEINDETYNFALENLEVNPSISHKIKPYNFGLSDENADVDIYCLPGSDGVTTTELQFTDTQSEWLKRKEKMEIKKAKVKEASLVIEDIIKNEDINSNIVLKIDTEGSEHKIIDNLINKDILDKVDLIMGENHLESEDLDKKLVGFKNVYKIYHNDTIYSFCYVKDKYYKVLPLSEVY